MGKTAFIFPGQGSQYAGMGKEIHDSFASARTVFREADRAVGFALSELCFHGPEDTLSLTQYTQPAILTVSIALLRVLQDRGYIPDYVAGHSLGEYTALICAGSLSLAEGVEVVHKRGQYMQEAVPPGAGAMAAILGLGSARVVDACAQASSKGVVSAANFNAPDQTVIAGEASAVMKAIEVAKENGAKRALSLPVSAPFHCSLMAPARDKLAADLMKLNLRDLEIPLICNADAGVVFKGEEARDALIRQVCAPVRWVESIQCLAARGVDRFVEVGPGRVLCGLVKKILPQAETVSADGIRGIEALASVFSNAKM
jgi:[acyl-carrier-protein] S-malonyltransferase